MRPVYLDHNATTPVEPDVLKAMLPFLQGEFGNPSSSYALGRRAREAIENARVQVAALIGASAPEIVFTSGGTESSNIAIRSGATSAAVGRRRIVTTAIEHPATDACCDLLARDGFEVRRVLPRQDGIVRAEDFKPLVDGHTALVTVIHAQNEIGTLQPVEEISAIARSHGALMHADAAQSVGKVPLDVRAIGVDLLSIAGHKLYAPKGIGALYVRAGVEVASVLVGAGQEHGRRPGTENVPFIVGLGEACRIAAQNLESAPRMKTLADRLLAALKAEIPGLILTGDPVRRLPNTLNVLFPGVSGRALLESCPLVFASNGSACHADREQASAVLRALGLPETQALGAIRLSLGRHTRVEEIDAAATHLIEGWRRLRQNTGAELIPAK